MIMCLIEDFKVVLKNKTKLKETKRHSGVKPMSVFNGAVVRRKTFYVGLIEHIFVKAH